ncbi:hypothetical protein FSOLCH5_005886 [Fusarium solani]
MGGLRRDPIPLPTSRTLSRCLAQGWPGFWAAARCGSRSRLSLSFLGVCWLASLAATASGTLKRVLTPRWPPSCQPSPSSTLSVLVVVAAVVVVLPRDSHLSILDPFFQLIL